jgi:hypothetical protein
MTGRDVFSLMFFSYEFLKSINIYGSQALVAYACNPSYSGGRDQENLSSRPVGQIVHETLF